jgi:hypothetical protein
VLCVGEEEKILTILPGEAPMAIILRYLQDDAFQPDDVKAMSMALDDLCRELKIDGDSTAKETVAVRIIELARCGERSPTRRAPGPTSTTRGGRRDPGSQHYMTPADAAEAGYKAIVSMRNGGRADASAYLAAGRGPIRSS